MAGTHWNHLKILHDVYEASEVAFSWEENDCFLRINFRVGVPIGFNFNIFERNFVKTFSEDEKFSCSKPDSKASDLLQSWFDILNQEPDQSQLVLKIKGDKSLPVAGAEKILSVPDYRKFDYSPEILSPPPKIEVTVLGKEKKQMTIVTLSFDDQGQPHGLAELLLYSPTDVKTYGFKLENVTSIQGIFVHGELQGPTLVQTIDQRVSFLTVKNGVAHGPAVIIGSVPILPVSQFSERLFETIDEKLKFC